MYVITADGAGVGSDRSSVPTVVATDGACRQTGALAKRTGRKVHAFRPVAGEIAVSVLYIGQICICMACERRRRIALRLS